MLRHCRQEFRFDASRAIALAAFWCCLCFAASVALAGDKPQLSAARLRELANQAIRSGAIQFDPPKNRIDGNTMEVSDVCVLEAMDHDADNLYVRVFLDQIEIELRRQQLLQRPRSRQIMEPYYVKMEQLVGKKLSVVENPKLSDDDRTTELGKLSGQSMAIFSEGLTAVAKSIGLAQFAFSASAANRSRDVKLNASPQAKIDMVHQTTASLLKEAGEPESNFPWSNYQGGDTVPLFGTYYCRIRLNDREAASYKRVGNTTDSLNFPDP